jgi:hypothetical protein
VISCQLTKLESALDSIKKAKPKLMPADAALIASALTLSGRHAIALYEGEKYEWPQDIQKLTDAMVPAVELAQEAIDLSAPKKTTKTTVEEEPVTINVGLMPNLTAGENLLKGRDDLKTLLSDMLQEGVEFNYAPSDIGWQWALDRANWTNVSGHDMSRRIKVKTVFTEGAVGIETGTATKKKRTTKTAEAAAEVPAEEA